MAEALLCPQCGKTVPANAPQGLCPACMMSLGLPSEIAEQRTIPPAAARDPEAATLPPQTPAPRGEETVAHVGADTRPASSGSGSAPNDVPGYEILGELGRGGMGVVYKAKHLKLGRLVALKMILAGGHAGSAELSRFRTEAEAIARLQHPNIVQVHEISEHDGRPYFSLEFCSGGSLAQKTNGTPWRPKDAACIVETLARGMEAAHQKGVVHRDLKPANVLLLEDGTPKITDFGLAKKLDEASQTQSGAVMGTPSYMAPEQASGKGKAIGPATDVYALGAILYELLAGRPPFLAATALDTVLQVVSDDPVPLSQLQSKTPRDLETICLKCLQKDPVKRYASAHALAEDLRRFQAGEPIQARPVGNVERALKWVKRHPMTAALSAVIVAVTILAFGGISGGFGWALVERERAIDQEKKTALALGDTKKAQKKAEDEKAIAEEATKEMKKQLQRAETLVVQVKFENAFHQAEEKRNLSVLATAGLLREPIVMQNPALQQSLALHLGNWLAHLHPLQEVLPHKSSVDTVIFSPDGKTILTVSLDVAQLWQTSTGKPIGAPLRHQAVIATAAFSPDSRLVVTGSTDTTAQVWDAATCKAVGPPLKHSSQVNVVAFSPSGKTVLTATGEMFLPGEGRLWDPATGQPAGEPLSHKSGVSSIAFSKDGKLIVTGSYDKSVRLWDAETGKAVGAPMQHLSWVKAVAFSPDGKFVLTGSFDTTARLWQVAGGKPFGPILHHQFEVPMVAFSPDGKTVLTGSVDKTARLWETATGKPRGMPLQHLAPVTAVAFSPDSKLALTASFDKTARLWSTETGLPLGPPLYHQDYVRAIAFSPDGKTVLTGSVDRTARLWDISAGHRHGPPVPQSSGLIVVLSQDRKYVLTGGFTKTAQVWETATGKPFGPPLKHDSPVVAMAFGKNHQYVVTAWDKTAQLWETATGQPVGPPLKHQDKIQAVAVSPDGKTIVTGRWDKTAQLWEAGTGLPLGPPLQHNHGVLVALFSPDGKTVLTASKDMSARFWDAATGQLLDPPLQHRSEIRALAFSPDGKMVLTGSHDRTARIWDFATRQPIGLPLTHQGEVRAVAFSHDGRMVLTGSEDMTARVWETATGKPLGPPLQHDSWVVAVAFSADSKIALTGSEDKTARFWETATGKSLGPPMHHPGAVAAVAFRTDTTTALTRSRSGAVPLWNVPRAPKVDPARLLTWTQVITGSELDEFGQVRVLDAKTWQERRHQLEKTAGPP